MCNMFLVGTVILLSLFVGIFMPILAIKCFEKGFYINTGEKVDVTSEMKPVIKKKTDVDPETEKQKARYKKILAEIDGYNGGVK